MVDPREACARARACAPAGPPRKEDIVSTIDIAAVAAALGVDPDALAALMGEDKPKTASPKAGSKRKTAKQKAQQAWYEAKIKARVPCAYGSKSCEDKHFAPNGVGATQHTTCPKGLAAMKAARAK